MIYNVIVKNSDVRKEFVLLVLCCIALCENSAVETELASLVLDVVSVCLIGTSSWLTLPAAMYLARITISYFLDMYVSHLMLFLVFLPPPKMLCDRCCLSVRVN